MKGQSVTFHGDSTTEAQSPFAVQQEAARLAALRSLQILDTDPDEALDDVTRAVAAYFGVPISLISLVDQDRQWFKSKVGLEVSETPREISFCHHTILGPNVFVVPDTGMDPRFKANRLVTGDPHIRFYAGAPLCSSMGYRIGSLCLIDHKARLFNAVEQAELSQFAALASAIIEDLFENRHIAQELLFELLPGRSFD